MTFLNLRKKDIKPLAKAFLNEPSHEDVEEMLKEGKLLLLIDNYIENEEHEHAVNRLKRFINDYPFKQNNRNNP